MFKKIISIALTLCVLLSCVAVGTFSIQATRGVTTDTEKSNVVYFVNTYGWASVYGFGWTDGIGSDTVWPGKAATVVDAANGVYSYNPGDRKEVLFHNNEVNTSFFSCAEVYGKYIEPKTNTYYDTAEEAWNAVNTEVIEHSWDEGVVTKEATCTETGVKLFTCIIDECGQTKAEEIPAIGHSYDNGFVTKEATCTEAGVKLFTCIIDECSQTKTEEIPAIGHTEVIDKSVAPSCTETGLTKGAHCSICGEVLVEQTVVEAIGHNYGKWENDRLSSCSMPGQRHKECKLCGNLVIEYTGILEHVKSDWILDEEATCTKVGKKHKECIVCKTVLESELVEIENHIEIVDNAVAPTCTATGLTEGKHCSVCNEVIVAQTTVEKLPHNTVIGSKKATYFEAGYKNKETCQACGEVISDGTVVKKLKLAKPKVTVTGTKKKITVKYTKVTGATGFEVKYKVGKKNVTKVFNTKKTATKTIKKLAKGTYKVQVRAFVKQGSKTAYSSWTKATNVKVK